MTQSFTGAEYIPGMRRTMFDDILETASWVVVNRETGKAVFETFCRRVADAINLNRYEVVPIGEYLASLNRHRILVNARSHAP